MLCVDYIKFLSDYFVITTVEENLTESERRDYEIDLEKYIKTMGMIRTGREEGREEGRLEAQKDIARAMLKEGLPVEMISRITGIAIENDTRQQ